MRKGFSYLVTKTVDKTATGARSQAIPTTSMRGRTSLHNLQVRAARQLEVSLQHIVLKESQNQSKNSPDKGTTVPKNIQENTQKINVY